MAEGRMDTTDSGASSDASNGGVSNGSVKSVKQRLLDRVARSDGHFRHQQRGDPDLTYDEKLKIATELLEQKPSTFLGRFAKYLEICDLPYFDHLQGDYTIDFYLKEIVKRHDDSKSHKVIRNRRYEAMKKLLESGEYFSDKEMKSRDPMLYEQMIGQYLSEEEIQQQVEAGAASDGSISALLLQHIEALHNNTVYERQKEQEENQMEEEEDSSEEEEMVESPRKMEEDEEEEDEMLCPAEKLMLRNEFESIMQQRFLSGEDKDFDYGTVDDNVEYDSLDIRGRDEEEKYFDEDDDYFSETDGELDDEKCDYFTKSCSILKDKDDPNTVKLNTEMLQDPT